MSKKVSIVLISIITAVVIGLGVFCFLPDDLPFGATQLFHAPINLLDKDMVLGDSVQVTFVLENTDVYEDYDEYVEVMADTAQTMAKRLEHFGLYDYKIEEKPAEELLIATLPNVTDYDLYLEAISSIGTIEFLTTTTYDTSAVLLAQYDFETASKEHYSYDTSSYWIIKFKVKTDSVYRFNSVTSASTMYVALNGDTENLATIDCSSDTSKNELYIYVDDSSESVADELISWVKTGAYISEIINIDSEDVEAKSNVSLIVGLLVAALFVAVAVLLIVKYKLLGIASVLAIALMMLLEVLFASVVYFSVMNVFTVIAYIITLGVMTYLVLATLSKAQKSYDTGKTVKASLATAFNKSLILNAIVCGAMLVVGIVLWVIPTAVTAYSGIALLYGAVASFIACTGVFRVLTMLLYPVGAEENTSYGLNK